jgi:hypothetical protein
MRINFPAAITRLAIVTVMLLGGCTTYVAHVKKDEAYTKRLTETSVVWTSPGILMTRITRSARGSQPSISEKDKAQSKKNIADLQALFSREFPRLVSAALQNSSVTVQPIKSAAATQLRITPTYSETECVPLGCTDSLWLQVQLFDIQERKSVWSGRFKVGAPMVWNTNDVTVVQSFTDTLVSQLKSSNLL